jgi:hypothetical protein
MSVLVRFAQLGLRVPADKDRPRPSVRHSPPDKRLNAETMKVKNALVRATPVVPSVACCAVLFTPWVTTGTAARSGFAFLRAASAAGLLGGAGVHMLEALVFALPALAALSCAAAVWGAPLFSAISSGVAGMVVGAFSLEIFIVFGAHAEVGPWLGVVSAVAAIVISARHSAKLWPGRTPLAVEKREVQNA